VIVSEDGHVVTSAWNFDSRPQVIVVATGDGRSHAARVLGIDRAAGLALLKIDATGLPVPEFLDPERVRVGSWAFAIGRAVTQEAPTVKYGVISAKNRIQGNALQTDAASSPVNYGGPLVDTRGRVYGILVPLDAGGGSANPNWYDSGIGFAAPIPDPAKLVERLGREGVVLEPAFLGVTLDEDRTEPGARVTELAPDQAAAKAGMLEGDIVVEAGGEPVANAFTLRFAIGRRRAGDTLRLKIRRGPDEKDIEVVLGVRPAESPDPGKIPVPLPAPDDGGKE
jgi:serine protease Do